MRILYFHQHFSTPRGGEGIRSYQLSMELLRQGHTVTMVCGSNLQGSTNLTGDFVNGRREGMVDGIKVIEFSLSYSNNDSFLKRSGTFLSFAWNSVWVALREPCDLVFATTTPLTAAIPGIAARWLRGKPFVFEVRDLWPELPKAMGVITNPVVLGMMSVLEWVAYHSAQRCVGLSPGIVEGITRRGIAPSRVAMVPNGCDIELLATDKVEPFYPQGLTPADFIVVYTGTFGIANGLDAVLDAAAVLKKRGNAKIKIALVGDGKTMAHLLKRAKTENLDNVSFHSRIPKTSLAGLYKAAGLGLQVLSNVPAFYYGTSPNKFFDYLASGLPVLTNYPGWVADLVKENNCGLAVPPQDAEKFADALIYAEQNREEMKAAGRNANILARTQFERSSLARKWVAWVIGTLKP